jgi:hypothetical protein
VKTDHEKKQKLAKELRKGYSRYDMAKLMFGRSGSEHLHACGGRKAHHLDSEPKG